MLPFNFFNLYKSQPGRHMPSQTSNTSSLIKYTLQAVTTLSRHGSKTIIYNTTLHFNLIFFALILIPC